MDWTKYLVKLPLVVTGITGIINLVKGASEEDKRAAIRQAVMSSVSLSEFMVDKDVFNDAEVGKLFDALVDAEMAVQKAREALKVALNKQ
jgi:hypothetical protein